MKHLGQAIMWEAAFQNSGQSSRLWFMPTVCAWFNTQGWLKRLGEIAPR